jgi:hypothetical protein
LELLEAGNRRAVLAASLPPSTAFIRTRRDSLRHIEIFKIQKLRQSAVLISGPALEAPPKALCRNTGAPAFRSYIPNIKIAYFVFPKAFSALSLSADVPIAVTFEKSKSRPSRCLTSRRQITSLTPFIKFACMFSCQLVFKKIASLTSTLLLEGAIMYPYRLNPTPTTFCASFATQEPSKKHLLCTRSQKTIGVSCCFRRSSIKPFAMRAATPLILVTSLSRDGHWRTWYNDVSISHPLSLDII